MVVAVADEVIVVVVVGVGCREVEVVVVGAVGATIVVVVVVGLTVTPVIEVAEVEVVAVVFDAGFDPMFRVAFEEELLQIKIRV